MKNLNKTTKDNLITYGMVIAVYIIVEILLKAGMISSLLQGLLVPLCVYVVLAVSLAVWNRGRIVSGADVGAGAVKRRPKHIKGETPRPETAPEGVQTVPAQPEEPAAIPESSQP